jgi:hypothetical protein
MQHNLQALEAYEAGLARNPDNAETSRKVSSLRRKLQSLRRAEANEAAAIAMEASEQDKVHKLPLACHPNSSLHVWGGNYTVHMSRLTKYKPYISKYPPHLGLKPLCSFPYTSPLHLFPNIFVLATPLTSSVWTL